MESSEGKTIAEQKLRKGWFGYHSWIDEELFIPADRYALTFIQRFSSANTYLVLDIKMETVDEILARIDLGNNSIKALISPDGREVVRIQQEGGDIQYEGGDNEIVFVDKEFYGESTDVFGRINNCVEVLIEGIKNIAGSIEEVDQEKEQIQEVIDNVSSVTEQTAASMGEIMATLDGQVRTVAELADEIAFLKEGAVKLEQMIEKFKVSEK